LLNAATIPQEYAAAVQGRFQFRGNSTYKLKKERKGGSKGVEEWTVGDLQKREGWDLI
jgi:hypothetical protein